MLGGREAVQTFGEYLLLEMIGKGGTGAAYLATRPTDAASQPLVVKRLHPDLAGDRVLALRLRHEATIAVSVDDPHVVRVLDVGAVDGEPYVAMDHVPGWPLAKLLQHLGGRRELLPVEAALGLAAGILRGLAALHEAVHPETGQHLGVVHRDISPRNVLVTPAPRATIIDLGLGKSNVKDWATRAGAAIGTPGYMAPEQALGLPVDHRADIYAAAVMVFELLTVQRYIERAAPGAMIQAALAGAYRPLAAHRPDAPSALDQVLSRALSVRPEERYASAMELLGALEEAVGAPLDEPSPGFLPQAFHEDAARRAAEIAALLDGARDLEAGSGGKTEVYARRSSEAAGGSPAAPAGARTIDDRRRWSGDTQTTEPPPGPFGAQLGAGDPTESAPAPTAGPSGWAEREASAAGELPDAERTPPVMVRPARVPGFARAAWALGLASAAIAAVSALVTVLWLGARAQPRNGELLVTTRATIEPRVGQAEQREAGAMTRDPHGPDAAGGEDQAAGADRTAGMGDPRRSDADRRRTAPPDRRGDGAAGARGAESRPARAPPPVSPEAGGARDQPPADPAERLDFVMQRAAALKRARPELAAGVNRLLTGAALWRSSSTDDATITRRLGELEAELARLERSPPSGGVP